MKLLYPADFFRPTQPDEMFVDEINGFAGIGVGYSVINIDEADSSVSRLPVSLEKDQTVVYRGWMVTQEEYRRLLRVIVETGAQPLTDVSRYDWPIICPTGIRCCRT